MTPTNLQLRSLVRKTGELQLSLERAPLGEPRPDEVLVRVEASPINPSDLALMLGGADMSTLQACGSPDNPVVIARMRERLHRSMRAAASRLDQSVPLGNEGAGVVVKAGSSPAAQALIGKTVAMLGGQMYSQYRQLKATQCLPLPEGTTATEGASCFVNPITALCMVETMRREGHTALVHTAAASNLGQMLNRLCIQDHIPLVSIVRRQEHEDMLRAAGAEYVCNSAAPTFRDDLIRALSATGATLAFDAVGGGRLAGQILACMEAVASEKATQYSVYGSTTFKQVYIYGALDRGPTELTRNFGMAWSVGGWLLRPFLQKIGAAAEQSLRERVVRELKITFASHYVRELSLTEALRPENIVEYCRLATTGKYLINPSRNLRESWQ